MLDACGYLVGIQAKALILHSQILVNGARLCRNKFALDNFSLPFKLQLLALDMDVGIRGIYLRLSQTYGFQHVGFFLYYSPDLLGPGKQDQALRLGPDFSFYSRRLRFLGQFLAAYDSNPTGHGQELWYYGGFFEGNYRFSPALVSLLRLDYAWAPKFDDTSEGGRTRVRRRLWGVTGGGQWLLLENLKFVAEATYSENHEEVTDRTVQSWSFTVRLVTAFWPLTPPGLSGWVDRRKRR